MLEIQFESVKQLLTTLRQDLITEKARINDEIDKDVADCERALKALDTILETNEKVNRMPCNGDVLVALTDDQRRITANRSYQVMLYHGIEMPEHYGKLCIVNDIGGIDILDDQWATMFSIFSNPQIVIAEMVDENNLHSYLHANKPI